MKFTKKDLTYLFRLLEADRSICQMHLDEANNKKKPLEKSMEMILDLQLKIVLQLRKLEYSDGK